MHSNIYQISEKPLKLEDYIDESDYYESLVGHDGIDYVDDIDPSVDAEELKWLGTRKGLSVDVKNRTLTITDKKAYFKNAFKRFKELTEKLNQISLDEFITPSHNLDVYNLHTAYDDDYNIRVNDNGERFGVESLDTWVRYTPENQVFYIGRVTDYHY